MVELAVRGREAAKGSWLMRLVQEELQELLGRIDVQPVIDFGGSAALAAPGSCFGRYPPRRRMGRSLVPFSVNRCLGWWRLL
jgi:hypothetical protein